MLKYYKKYSLIYKASLTNDWDSVLLENTLLVYCQNYPVQVQTFVVASWLIVKERNLMKPHA